ncbi:unnamed protein product, partial [Trichogramma brassicae]
MSLRVCCAHVYTHSHRRERGQTIARAAHRTNTFARIALRPCDSHTHKLAAVSRAHSHTYIHARLKLCKAFAAASSTHYKPPSQQQQQQPPRARKLQQRTQRASSRQARFGAARPPRAIYHTNRVSRSSTLDDYYHCRPRRKSKRAASMLRMSEKDRTSPSLVESSLKSLLDTPSIFPLI